MRLKQGARKKTSAYILDPAAVITDIRTHPQMNMRSNIIADARANDGRDEEEWRDNFL